MEYEDERRLPDDVDDLLDGLSWHDRNRILGRYGQEAEEPPSYFRPVTRGQSILWWIALPLSVIWAIAMLAIGLAALFIGLIPITIAALGLGAAPVGWLVIWRLTSTEATRGQEGQDE